MKIIFKSVKYKNFLSIGNNFISIDLNTKPMTLVTGPNGAAKSSILDALHFALYGSAFRAINKGNLVNSTNHEKCLVELTLESNGIVYTIKRGIKPNLLEVYRDGELESTQAGLTHQQQNIESNILGGMTSEVFKQIIVLGSANYIPFMELPAAKRRAAVESMLDIGIFSTMNEVNRLALRETASVIHELEYKRDTLSTALHTAEAYQATTVDMLDRQLAGFESKVQAAQVEYDKVLHRLPASQPNLPSLDNVLKKVAEFGSAKAAIVNDVEHERRLCSELDDQIKFFEEHSICPTCKQPIDQPVRDQNINQLRANRSGSELRVNELRTKIGSYTDTLAKLNKLLVMIQVQEHERIDYDSVLAVAKSTLTSAQAALEQAKTARLQPADDTKQSDVLTSYRKDIAAAKEQLKAAVDKYGRCKVIDEMLKDSGVKSKIIARYIPMVNASINEYLKALSFDAQFTLDENFNEVVKSHFRDTFEYNSFSQGEKLRIDIAIMFAWRDILRSRNSLTTNLLVMDEILDGAMDSSGAFDFLKIVNNREGSNMFIMSHRGDQLAERFNSILEFSKHGNFSEVKQVA